MSNEEIDDTSRFGNMVGTFVGLYLAIGGVATHMCVKRGGVLVQILVGTLVWRGKRDPQSSNKF